MSAGGRLLPVVDLLADRARPGQIRPRRVMLPAVQAGTESGTAMFSRTDRCGAKGRTEQHAMSRARRQRIHVFAGHAPAGVLPFEPCQDAQQSRLLQPEGLTRDELAIARPAIHQTGVALNAR